MLKVYEGWGLPNGAYHCFALERRCPQCSGHEVAIVGPPPFFCDGGPSTWDDLSLWKCGKCAYEGEGGSFAGSHTPLPTFWWGTAMAAAQSIQPGRSGRDSVYVALLQKAETTELGLYVGMTGLSPIQRYQNHKADHQAGRGWVRDYGVGLLPELTDHLPRMCREDVLAAEQSLISAFRAAGIKWVEGH